MLEYLWLALYFLALMVAGSFLFYGLLFGAMYMRVPTRITDKVIKLSKLKPTKRFYDLGAGLGTMAFEAAYNGAAVTAVEVNPIMVAAMKSMLLMKRVGEKIQKPFIAWIPAKYMRYFRPLNMEIKQANLLKVDLSSADIVYCYLFGPLMQKVGAKAQAEMKKGAKLISVEHQINGWKPSYVDNKDKIYVYQIPNAFAVEV